MLYSRENAHLYGETPRAQTVTVDGAADRYVRTPLGPR